MATLSKTKKFSINGPKQKKYLNTRTGELLTCTEDNDLFSEDVSDKVKNKSMYTIADGALLRPVGYSDIVFETTAYIDKSKGQQLSLSFEDFNDRYGDGYSWLDVTHPNDLLNFYAENTWLLENLDINNQTKVVDSDFERDSLYTANNNNLDATFNKVYEKLTNEDHVREAWSLNRGHIDRKPKVYFYESIHEDTIQKTVDVENAILSGSQHSSPELYRAIQKSPNSDELIEHIAQSISDTLIDIPYYVPDASICLENGVERLRACKEEKYTLDDVSAAAGIVFEDNKFKQPFKTPLDLVDNFYDNKNRDVVLELNPVDFHVLYETANSMYPCQDERPENNYKSISKPTIFAVIPQFDNHTSEQPYIAVAQTISEKDPSTGFYHTYQKQVDGMNDGPEYRNIMQQAQSILKNYVDVSDKFGLRTPSSARFALQNLNFYFPDDKIYREPINTIDSVDMSQDYSYDV